MSEGITVLAPPPLDRAKIVEFYNGLKASPPAFIAELILLVKTFGPLIGTIFPQYAGYIAELEAALQLFSATAIAPLQNLDQCLAYLMTLSPNPA